MISALVKKGSAAAKTAHKLFNPMGVKPVAIGDINYYEGTKTVIETPYITTANALNWFLLDSSLVNPLYVGIGEMPTLREPLKEKNESIRTNISGFYKFGIVDLQIGIYGSTGAV